MKHVFIILTMVILLIVSMTAYADINNADDISTAMFEAIAVNYPGYSAENLYICNLQYVPALPEYEEDNLWQADFYRTEDNKWIFGVVYRVCHDEILLEDIAIQYRDPDNLMYTLQDLEVEKGSFRLWSIEEQAAFDAFLRNSITDYADQDITVLRILEHHHGLPDEKCIDQEKALEIAKRWLVNNGVYDENTLGKRSILMQYWVDDPDQPVWSFAVCKENSLVARECCVSVNARSGDCWEHEDKR